MPIHDHLHWSLLIICHPGADPADSTVTPCMLHLDSMKSARPALADACMDTRATPCMRLGAPWLNWLV